MTYYKPGGPIFLLIGGEWALEEKDTRYIEDGPGQMYGKLVKWAKEHHAAIIYLDHRYYGQSIPRKYKKVDDYKWLSSR